MKLEKLLEMGGKEWIDSEVIEVENDKFEKKINKHRVYFNDKDEILEAAGLEASFQDFYFDLLENKWGDLCGYEVDKMIEFYGE